MPEDTLPGRIAASHCQDSSRLMPNARLKINARAKGISTRALGTLS